MSYKSVWDLGRAGKANYSVHAIGEYPSKIRPLVFSHILERFSKENDIVLDPFCGCGTNAVEAKLQGRNSISYDINPKAVELCRKKIAALDRDEMLSAVKEMIQEYEKELSKVSSSYQKITINKQIKKLNTRGERIRENGSHFLDTTHKIEVIDARDLPLDNESVDAVITDIPYASMIRYSDISGDLSLIEDYDEFLHALKNAFEEMWRVLRKDKYLVVFCADYRIGASRKILPVHVDVVNLMRDLGLTLFDTYIWRYYRSGGFRPFGAPPYQAMNVHIYILIFHKPTGDVLDKPNRPVRYRKKLVEKIENNN